MFTNRFQSDLAQVEGVLGNNADIKFDSALGLETLYTSLGATFNVNTHKSLNFITLLSSPKYANFLQDCASNGLVELLYYGKTATNAQSPAIWSLKGATLKKALSQVSPYLGCATLARHLQAIRDIANRMPAEVPNSFTEALKNSAKVPASTRAKLVMAVTGLLNHGLMLYNRPIRDKNKNITGYETSFITRSYSLIAQMSRMGLFSESLDPAVNQAENAAVFARFTKAIYGGDATAWGTTMANALEDGTIAVVKITPQMTTNSGAVGIMGESNARTSFNLVVPKGNIDITDPDVSILPLSLMRCFTNGLISYITTQDMVEITSQGFNGEPDYVSRVTATPAVFEKVYADCEDKTKIAERAYMPIGFNINTCSLMLLNLESSLYGSKGYVKINPYNIKSIKPIYMKDLDTTAHSLNPVAIYATFEKSLNGLDYEGLVNVVRRIPTLARLVTSTNQPVNLNLVVSLIPRVHYSEILKYLTSIDPNAIKEIRSVGTRSTVNKTPLQGTTLDEKRANLEVMLANNYVAISYLSKEGSREVIATNNGQLLAAKLGNDYKLRYEGWNTQCAVLKSYILNSAPTKQTINEMIASYGIKYLDINELTGITEPEIDAWIASAEAKRPQRKQSVSNPDNISVRCIPAAPYFRTLKLSNIQGVAVLDNV